MASGIEMMLKSLGFDPKAIMAEFEGMRKFTIEKLNSLDQRLSNIEKTQAELLKLNLEVAKWMNQQEPQQPSPHKPQLVAQPSPQLQPTMRPENLPSQPSPLSPQPQPLNG